MRELTCAGGREPEQAVRRGELAQHLPHRHEHRQPLVHRPRLVDLHAIRDRFAGRADLAHRLLSVELGIRLSDTAAGFWEEIQSAASASASTASGDWAASITTMRSGSAAASAS